MSQSLGDILAGVDCGSCGRADNCPLPESWKAFAVCSMWEPKKPEDDTTRLRLAIRNARWVDEGKTSERRAWEYRREQLLGGEDGD